MGMGCLYKTCSFTQQTEPKTLRKPETMGSGEVPRSMGVMTATQDAADSKLDKETKEGWKELSPEHRSVCGSHSMKYSFILKSAYPCRSASNLDSKLKKKLILIS